MARIKRGVVSRRKHKKLLEMTKGYRGTRRRLVRRAHEAVLHTGAYAYHGRKRRKRDFRRLWITRIGQAASLQGTSYSVFIANLKKANIQLDRKILADLVLTDPPTFQAVLERAKSS